MLLIFFAYYPAFANYKMYDACLLSQNFFRTVERSVVSLQCHRFSRQMYLIVIANVHVTC